MLTLIGKARGLARASVVALAVAAAMTGTAQAAEYYGAIAFSQTTGSHGYSFDYGSRGAAQNRALQECARYGGGCIVAAWFRNACGALAVGNGNGWGAEWGRSRAEAQRLALQRCNANTSGCQVVRWVCTTR